MFKVSIFNSLFVKVFALFWLTFGLLLILSFSFSQMDTRRYANIDSDEIRAYQQKILMSIRERAFLRLLVAPEFFIEQNKTEVRPFLVDNQGTVLGVMEEELPFVHQFIKRSNDLSNPKHATQDEMLLAGPFAIHLSNEGQAKNYSVYFISYVNPQKEIMNYIFDRPFLLILVIMLVSTPILGLLVYSLTMPIRRFQIAANLVAQGDFSINKSLETTGTIELRQVGKSFNRMAKSLEDLIESRQQMLSAISHELRTPLTRLQLATALIRRKFGDSNEIQRIETEIERLNQMIGDALQLSRHRMQNVIHRENIPLSKIWQRVLDDAKFEAKQMGIHLHIVQLISEPDKFQIFANQEGLSCAVENIVRNGLKYTKDRLAVTLQIKGDNLFIIVDDNGDGVAEEEYSRIFIPFYRVDEERTRIKSGAGLGLALVQNSVQLHGGEVWAEKSYLGGLKVVIKLPLAIA